jgi:FixJ family two-component response regulator
MLDALNAGATNYITKPFEDANVLDVVADALNQR